MKGVLRGREGRLAGVEANPAGLEEAGQWRAQLGTKSASGGYRGAFAVLGVVVACTATHALSNDGRKKQKA